MMIANQEPRAATPAVHATFYLLLLLLSIGMPSLSGNAQLAEKTTSREEELNKLMDIIRNDELRASNPEQVVEAIQRLGEMKATRAVDDLVGLLTFRNWLPWERNPNEPKVEPGIFTSRQRYPAVFALIRIGEASVPPLIKVIEAHDPASLETHNAMEVLIVLSRYERPAFVQKLKDAAASAVATDGKLRLIKAAEDLEKSKR